MEDSYESPLILKVYRWPGENRERPYEYTIESECGPTYFGTKEDVLEELEEALELMEVDSGQLKKNRRNNYGKH